MQPIWYGYVNCNAIYASGKNKGLACVNKAYYSIPGQSGVYCGVHSKKDIRIELPKNPHAPEDKAKRLDAELSIIERVRCMNLSSGQTGIVIVSKLRMRKEVESFEGFYKVFPNFKHGNRKDGFGCPSLSPMSLGPVKHLMPGYPEACNLENFYQFAKVYAFELDPATGIQSASFHQYRVNGYLDTIPHRHKFTDEYLKSIPPELQKTLYSVYADKNGQLRTYTYLESRYFYCKIYELLSKGNPELATLREKLTSGVNLQIVGYDGYPIFEDRVSHTPDELKKRCYECYLDVSKPFGHECVLYVLLTITNQEDYPWNIFYHKNLELYPEQLLV
jgi:hypothetical protein